MRCLDVILLATLLHLAYAFSATRNAEQLVQLRPDNSANDVLQKILQEDEASSHQSPILLEGMVTKRRAIGKHLVFLDIVPLDLPEIQQGRIGSKDKKRSSSIYDEIELITPVQAILRRDVWNGSMNENKDSPDNTISSYDVYHKIIQPGAHVQLNGHAGPSRNANEAVLFCQNAKFTLVNDNPQHVRNVLRFVKEGVLDFGEVLDALPCIDDSEELITTIGLGNQENRISFGDAAVEVLERFPRNFLCNPSKLMGSTNSQKVKLLPPAPSEYGKAPELVLDDSGETGDVSTIADLLQEQSNLLPNEYKQFTISGWVQNRRRYQGSITVLELVDEFSSLAKTGTDDADNGDEESNSNAARISELRDLWKMRIYSVLHPDALQPSDDATRSSIELSETYGNILGTGARVMLKGYMSAKSKEDAAVFWVTNCRLLRSSWRLSTVKQALDLLHEGKFDVDEASDALELSGGYSEAQGIANGSTSATERQWMAAEITQKLQGENSRVGTITSSMKQSLETFADARIRYPMEKMTRPEVDAVTAIRESVLQKSRDGTRWQRAKRPQLQFMIQQISTVLRSHPDFGSRKLKLVDIGGGRGLLSNLLAEHFGEDAVEVQVVDISRQATNNGMMTAKRRGLQNIQYQALDATELDVTGVDVVVALHACGALTDVALGHAVCQGAGFVVCPCCFRSNPHLRVSVPAGKNKRSMVTAEDWLEVDPMMYGCLKQLAELQGDINMASKAMHTINGLRATAANKLWHYARRPEINLDISIKSFPVGFSTRNLCLVGKFDGNK